MDIQRQREILINSMIGGQKLTFKEVKEILADEEIISAIQTEPLLGVAINWLENFYDIHTATDEEE